MASPGKLPYFFLMKDANPVMDPVFLCALPSSKPLVRCIAQYLIITWPLLPIPNVHRVFLFFLINFIYLFIFGGVGSSLLHAGFLRCCTWAFLIAASEGYSSLQCTGFSLQWLFVLRSTGFRRAGFSSCGTQAQSLWHTKLTGLVAPRHVRSSRTRDRTRVPCIGRQILNHCATREVPHHVFLILLSVF